jgi:hypothetical protein
MAWVASLLWGQKAKTVILGDFAVLADRSGQAFVTSSGYQDVS